MTRRILITIAVMALVVGLGVAIAMRVASATPADQLRVAGDVRVTSRTIAAPALSLPTPDYAVGIPTKTIAMPKGKAPTQPARSGQPVVSGVVGHVYVRVGDAVTAGQSIAQLDTALLDLGIAQAKTDAARAKTNVRVIKNNLTTILDNIDKLGTGRSQLAAGRAALAKAKAALKTAKSQLLAAQSKLLAAKKNRKQYEAQLADLEAKAAHFPPGQVPADLAKGIAQLKGLLASIDPGLAKVDAGLAKVAAGEAQLATAEAKLNTAAGQLNTAADALSTAKKQVVNARDTLSIVADSQQIGIELARARRQQATILSPVAGVVTYVVPAGTVAMVGSPVAKIRPDGPVLVDTYLTVEQLSRIKLGTRADVTYDSAPGKVLHGEVAIIGLSAIYPPTSFPTDVVHMTRTVKVTIRLDSGDAPPQGTPVDIAIHTN